MQRFLSFLIVSQETAFERVGSQYMYAIILPSSLTAAKPPSLTDVVILSSTTARVHWVPPEGEDGIVGYGISFTPAIAACPGIEGGLQMVTGGTSTQALLTGLEEYTEYNITVMTHNPVGIGPPSDVWIVKTEADSE